MMLLSLKPLLHRGQGAKKRGQKTRSIFHVNLTMKHAQWSMSGITNYTTEQYMQFSNGQEKPNTCLLTRLP